MTDMKGLIKRAMRDDDPALLEIADTAIKAFNEGKEVSSVSDVAFDILDFDPDQFFIGSLVGRFPKGFIVSMSGKIFEVIYAAPARIALAKLYPNPPEHGGYAVVQKDDASELDVEHTTKVIDLLDAISEISSDVEGIAISQSGVVFNVLFTCSALEEVFEHYPTPPDGGGYMVARIPEFTDRDQEFLAPSFDFS